MKERLESLGLSSKEAVVYIALIKGGEMTAEQLARLSNLNRSTTYVQIKYLIEIGLVSTFKRGKKTFFSAESPNNIERLLDKKGQELEIQRSETKLLVQELLKIYGSKVDRPSVRAFEGKEGLVSMRSDMLEANPGTILVAFSFDGMARIFNEEEMMDFSLKRANKKILSKAIYTKIGTDIAIVPPQQIKRVNEKDYPFGSDVYIYGDTVSFASTKDQVVGVTIKNADIAKTIRTLFEIAWDTIKN